MRETKSGKHFLLLCFTYPGCAQTILDHVRSFESHSRHSFHELSFMGDLPAGLDLGKFDGIFIHYSLIACHDAYLTPNTRRAIRQFTGFKAAFVQDDYRWINETTNALRYMRIHALFALPSQDVINEVYSESRLPNVVKKTVLTGYVSADLISRHVPSYTQRTVDIGYRARKLPAWIGSHTLQKWQIAEAFLQYAETHRLNTNISCREEDRLYGEDWIHFLSNCKTTLGTESGASICDFTGAIQNDVERHLAKYPDDDFDTLKQLYFANEDGRIIMNVISPRCFEAACLRVLMILYEGDYSGVLTPYRHYLPLKKNHSNIGDVIEVIRSPGRAQEIIDCAFQEIACAPTYTYASMINLVDNTIEECWRSDMRSKKHPYSPQDFEQIVRQKSRSTEETGEFAASDSGNRSFLEKAWQASPAGVVARMRRPLSVLYNMSLQQAFGVVRRRMLKVN